MNPIKILIVEDELLIAKGLARKLIKLGYQVLGIVSSGEDALEQLKETQPDLILMDIVIQGNMDGIETAELIHQNYHIPIIYLTAYADDQTLIRATATEAYGYILKPFKERELHATISIAMKQHEAGDRIRRSLAEAEAKQEDKARYLSITAHDLRTPMTTIKLSADILQSYEKKLTPDSKHQYLERIQNAINKMNQLLEDVLTLSEVDTVQLHLKQLNWVEVCEQLLIEFQPFTQVEHSLVLKTYGNLSDPGIYLDQRLLEHILSNLLSNAIKYSPFGGQILLELIRDETQIVFRVQDQGIGIPKSYYHKLFSQFERGDNVGKIKGTGLGLCIVKQAVDLHQGQIFWESEEGAGTTFTIVLPATLTPNQTGSISNS